MKKTVIGHVDCPVCEYDDAQVKEDKNGHAFIFCPDCAAQTFTRNEFRDRRLRARMRPVTVTVTEPLQNEPAAPTVTEQTKPPAKAAPVPAAPKPPTPKKNAPPVDPGASTPKKSGGWFSPLLAGG